MAKISGRLQVAKATLVAWNRELALEISQEEQEALAEIKTALKLSRLHRAEALGNMLNRLRQETAQRDLGTIPTEKLLDLTLKFATASAEAVLDGNGPNGTESGPNPTVNARVQRAEDEANNFALHFILLFVQHLVPCARDAFREVQPGGDVNTFLAALNTKRKRIRLKELQMEAERLAKQGPPAGQI